MNVQQLDIVPAGLPLGFAEQVMDLQIKLQEEESLELIQILTQMYKIAVDFYIDTDVRRAAFFQRKLNNLAIKAVKASSVEQKKPHPQKKIQLPNTINRQINKYNMCQQTYIKTIVENNKKQQAKINTHLQNHLNKQQEQLQGRRMLRRVKSQQRLFNNK